MNTESEVGIDGGSEYELERGRLLSERRLGGRGSRAYRIVTAALTAMLLLSATTVAQVAAAEVVTTEMMLQERRIASERTVSTFFERSEVASQLARLGLSAEEATTRLSALSDEEVAYLAQTIDDAPAGGDALSTVVVAIVFLFVLLLVTDIIGFTKVFPFTRSIR